MDITTKIDSFLNEAVEPNQKLAKKILPSGFVKYSDNSYDWTKRGGYSGKKTLEAIIKKAEALGFKRESGKPSSSADGNHVGNVSKYVNVDGVTLSLSSSFGSTKESNNYYASLSFPKKKLSEAKEERKTYTGDEVLSMLHKHVVSSKGQGKFGKDVVNAETGEVLIEGRKTYKALALEFFKAAYENSKKKLTPSTRQTHRSKVWSIYLYNKDGYETLSKNPDAKALEYYSMRWHQSYAYSRIADEGEKAKYHLY